MGIATAEFGSDASRGVSEVPAVPSRVGETTNVERTKVTEAIRKGKEYLLSEP